MTGLMDHTLESTNFQFRGQTGFYRGKVRDVYAFGDHLLMIATDRISAFDHILPRAIPHKGAVLNRLAAHFLKASADICPIWLLDTPDPNAAFGHRCAPLRVEMVIRGYLAGHAARQYAAGHRVLCGVAMPEGMREGDPFPAPIITPATKAEEGHDEDISSAELLARGLATPTQYQQMEAYTRSLFRRGTAMAAAQGLILVDTKYEFGLLDGAVVLMDEIHTPDSSRYFYADGYADRQSQGLPQQQLSKEFVREWLMASGFQGLPGQQMPEMPDAFVQEVSRRYIELFERVTGTSFVPPDTSDIAGRVERGVNTYLALLDQ
jgi:phosphoribosylaminoimidazole-succinocarboxamide synthase